MDPFEHDQVLACEGRLAEGAAGLDGGTQVLCARPSRYAPYELRGRRWKKKRKELHQKSKRH